MSYHGMAQRPSPMQSSPPQPTSNPKKRASQRDAGWNVKWACLKAYPSKHYDTRNKTSAGIGTTVEHPPRERIEMASIETSSKCVTRGMAQRPSPMQSSSPQPTSNPKNQPANAKRGGMWNGRASRRTQISIAIQENKTSAGIGTTVEHPPRKRIEIASIERALKCITTGKHSGPLLRRNSQTAQLPSEPLSLGQPLSSSHPQYESHDPPHAPSGHHA